MIGLRIGEDENRFALMCQVLSAGGKTLNVKAVPFPTCEEVLQAYCKAIPSRTLERFNEDIS